MRISDWSSDVCSSDLLVSPDRAVILGGIGLDLQEWSYSKPDAEAATFIMVGRLLRDKGVEEYVEAAKALHPHYPKARFMLVGGHAENPAALSLAAVQSWVDAGLIEWPGNVPVHPWWAPASGFVLPSYSAGL